MRPRTSKLFGESAPLRLEVVSGPPVEPVVLDPESTLLIGRASDCPLRLADPSVSRRHATISFARDEWMLTDLGSRHGTLLNGVAIPESQPVPIKARDSIGLGPWVFRAVDPRRPSVGIPTTDDGSLRSQRLETIVRGGQDMVAERRLELLLSCASAMNDAKNERDLALAVLRAAQAATGLAHAALVRVLGAEESVEVIAAADETGSPPPDMTFSRSLLRAAMKGEVVRLTSETPVQAMQSIMDLGIHEAFCAPVYLGEQVDCLLYLDSRKNSAQVHPESGAFCHALARLCGLALGNLRRAEVEGRNREFQRDMDAARAAQQLILPAESGRVGNIAYRVCVRSGRHVAGDLFGVVELPDGRAAVFVGDVSGKGAGAGILMTSCQTYLTAALYHHGDPARAVGETNRFLAKRSRPDQFVSLWLGVIDPGSGTIHFVDAGHGHCMIRRGEGTPHPIICEGGLPVSIEPDETYKTESISFGSGDLLLLYSDGVVEQPGPDGLLFGADRLISTIEGTRADQDCVDSIFDAVFAYAESDALADDTTVAAIRLLQDSLG